LFVGANDAERSRFFPPPLRRDCGAMIARESVLGRLGGVREFEDSRAPRWVKSGLSVGSGLLLAAGLFVGVVLRSVLLGVLLFALGAILFAVRGYLNTGDKVVAGALIFVSVVAIGIEAIVYFLGP
jgi:hypothetical protein